MYCISRSFLFYSSLPRCWQDMAFKFQLWSRKVNKMRQNHDASSSIRHSGWSPLSVESLSLRSQSLSMNWICFRFLRYWPLALNPLTSSITFLVFFQQMGIYWVREFAGIWMLFSLMVSLHQQFTAETTSERSGSTRGTDMESGTESKTQPPQIDASFVSNVKLTSEPNGVQL